MLTVKHKPCNLVDAERSGQILRPFIKCLSPILIDIKFPIPVQVLEHKSVPHQQADTGLRAVAKLCPTALFHEDIALHRNFLPMICAGDYRQCGSEHTNNSFYHKHFELSG